MRKVGAGLGSLATCRRAGDDVRAQRGRGAAGGNRVQRRGRRRAAEPGRGEAARAARGRAPEGARGRREGRASAAPARSSRSRGAPRRRGPVRRARAREDRQDLRVLAEFGDTRHPSYPDRDTDPNIPGPATFNGPLHNEIPAPDRSKDNSTVWQPDYGRAHYQDLYFGDGRRVAQDVLRAPVVGPLQRRRPGHRLGQGPATTRRATAAATATRARATSARNTWALIQDAIDAWVAGQKAAGAHRRADRRRPRVLRHVGPQRLRRRRQLQRAPTATSTTSRSSTPAATRPTATRSRARTRSGRTAGRRSRTDGTDGPGVQQGRRHADRHHRPVGRRLHDPARERRRLRVRARVRPRPRPARPLRHLAAAARTASTGGRSWRQSRVSAPRTRASAPAPADLGAWDKLQLGWLDYEIVPAGQTRTLDLGPHEYNSAKAQGVVVPLPQKTVVTDLGAPAAGPSSGGPGTDDDYDATLTRQVAAAGGHADAELPGALEHRGLRARPVRLRVRGGRRRHRLQGHPGLDHQGRRGQRHRRRRAAGCRRRSTCRPTPARRSACACTTAPTAPCRATDRERRGRLLRRRVRAHHGATCSPTAPRTATTAGRRTASRPSAPRKSELFDHYYVASNRHVRVVRPVPADRAVQLRLPGPAGLGRALPVPERPAGLLLGHLVLGQQHEPAPRPGRGPADRRQPAADLPARRQAVARRGSRATTRRSGSRSPTRSPCTRRRPAQASYIRGQAAVPLFDDRRVVLGPGAAVRGREGAQRRREDPGPAPGAARRCRSASARREEPVRGSAAARTARTARRRTS